MNQRAPRLRDPGFLCWLRRKPCHACGKAAPNDAAHLKAGNIEIGKPWAGSAKPDDTWATPLCRGCHMRQHAYGDEVGWWQAQGVVDPWALAARYYTTYRRENPNANPPYVRKLRSIKSRKPAAQRQKITGRGFIKGHRPFPSKGWHGG
jgi:hypothetical protein